MGNTDWLLHPGQAYNSSHALNLNVSHSSHAQPARPILVVFWTLSWQPHAASVLSQFGGGRCTCTARLCVSKHSSDTALPAARLQH